MTDSQQIAELIEHAARILDVCPRAVLTSNRLHRKNRITIARNCVLLHMYRAECPVDRLGRIFKLTPESIVKHLRLTRLMAHFPEYVQILTTFSAYHSPSNSIRTGPRHHAAKTPV